MKNLTKRGYTKTFLQVTLVQVDFGPSGLWSK